ncbi:MAG: glycoside hydrolase family 3 C-terminal domain-containing protein [Opitutaceae bacterium]|nr:glycoside hydrolase family 3 C-terminal domain-containing protein [Cytophagales bacterium]
MKKNSVFSAIIFISFLALNSCSKKQEPTKDSGDEIEKILTSLTLEEKVGQMTNLTLATIATEENRRIKLDTDKIRDIIVNHHVGSIQNVMNHAYTLEEWRTMVDLLQKVTMEQTRHKIPFLYCVDAVHGANYIYGATLFPHNIGLGATRNPELVEKCAAITAAETRASGVRYNFSPVLDVGRNQQWSRLGETFGEDVYLVTQLGGAAIKGFEGSDVSKNNKVASCMKHFVGYSVPLNGKDRAPAYIPEIVLREYFLPTFRNAVNIGSKTLMVNSAEINGTPVHASKYLLTDVLRTELGFKGVVISDWQDIIKLQERHRVAKTHKDAVFLAVDAGIDMCIVPFDFGFYNDLIALVKEGKISESRINESVRRILQLKKDLGLFQNPYVEKENIGNFGKPEYTATTLQAALESITLLKNNDSILPLSTTKKIMVTGPNANSVTALHGAWSYVWQGNRDTLYPTGLQSIAQVFSSSGAKFIPSFDYNGKNEWNKESLAKSASQFDAILVCLGEPAYAETPGNTPDIELDKRQVEMVQALAKTGKPIILLLLEGRPRIIREIEPLCKAILLGYWPGPQGAQAIHDVVFGKFNPGGKLPYTYPRYNGSLITYDHKLLDEAIEIVDPVYEYKYEFKPQYEFGHGLSYTTFTYDSIQFSKDTISTNDSLIVSVKVTNSGKLAGHEVVELYTQDLVASITPSVKRLRRFNKIFLQPGESKTISFTLIEKDLSFVNEKYETISEEGDFEVIIAKRKRKFYLKD